MSRQEVIAVGCAVMLAQGCVVSQEGPSDQMYAAVHAVRCSSEAQQMLLKTGVVVERQAVLPENGRVPFQLFDGYVEAEVPTLITTDLLVDGYLALQMRVLDEIDASLRPVLVETCEVIVDAGHRADSHVLRELGESGLAMLNEGVSLEGVGKRYVAPGTLLPNEVLLQLAEVKREASPALASYLRARKMLQMCRFDMTRADHKKAASTLQDDAKFKECVHRLTRPLAGVFGLATRVPLVESERLTDGQWRLLPSLISPAGEFWDGIGNPSTLVPVSLKDGCGPDGKRTPAILGEPGAGVWERMRKVSSLEVSAEEKAAVWHFLQALRFLGTPDRAAPAVFTSKEWDLVHVNTQLAALAQSERQVSAYTDIRVRSIQPEQPVPLVAPFSRTFAALAEAAEALAEARSERQEVGPAATEHSRLTADLAEFTGVCRSMVEVCKKQETRSALNESELSILQGVGEAMARAHGYNGNSYLSAKDDHSFSVLLGVARDGRALMIGVGRPNVAFVLVDRGDGPKVYRGLVYNYCEVARPVSESGPIEPQTPPSLMTYQVSR